jgi:hypothetical protein
MSYLGKKANAPKLLAPNVVDKPDLNLSGVYVWLIKTEQGKIYLRVGSAANLKRGMKAEFRRFAKEVRPTVTGYVLRQGSAGKATRMAERHRWINYFISIAPVPSRVLNVPPVSVDFKSTINTDGMTTLLTLKSPKGKIFKLGGTFLRKWVGVDKKMYNLELFSKLALSEWTVQGMSYFSKDGLAAIKKDTEKFKEDREAKAIKGK